MTDRIQGATRVCDVFRKYPKAAEYLLELGICECMGMQALTGTLEAQAKERELDLDKFLEELNRRA